MFYINTFEDSFMVSIIKRKINKTKTKKKTKKNDPLKSIIEFD